MSVAVTWETVESTIQWKIKNFSSIDASTGVQIRSPLFQTTHPNYKKLPWKLKFYPAGVQQKSKKYVGLFLRYYGDYRLAVSYSFSIINEDRDAVIKFTPRAQSLYENSQSWGVERFCSQSAVRDLLINDTLSISCTIAVGCRPTPMPRTAPKDEQCDEDVGVRTYHEKLLETGDLSDVTFEVESKQMRLHRTIVARLSPVFLAMFQHQMKEKEEGVVKITDMKYNVMMELFRYIYVGKVNDIESIAEDLLMAADKYDVQGLKTLCEKTLCQMVSVDNALAVFKFAVQYNTSLLKSTAVQFVASRLDEFVDKPEFDQLDGICKGEVLREIARKNKLQ